MGSLSPLNRNWVDANEREKDDLDDPDVEFRRRVSDLNQSIHGLEQEVSQLVLEDGESGNKLGELKRRVEEFKIQEGDLNRSVEEIEARVFDIMLAGQRDIGELDLSSEPGFEGLDNAEYDQCNEGFIHLKELSGRTEDLETELAELRAELTLLISQRNEAAETVEMMKTMFGNTNLKEMEETVKRDMKGRKVEGQGNISYSLDQSEDTKKKDHLVHKLHEEIEMLDFMSARGTVGLLDLEMMTGEIQALDESKTGVKELQLKLSCLQHGLWLLKKAIMEVKAKKIKEMTDCMAADGKNRLEKQEKGKGLNLNWPLVVVSVGTFVATAGLLFLGSGKAKTKAKENLKKGHMHHNTRT